MKVKIANQGMSAENLNLRALVSRRADAGYPVAGADLAEIGHAVFALVDHDRAAGVEYAALGRVHGAR